jgi:hypothetical protein
MWRYQVALILLLATTALAWTDSTIGVLGDSFTQTSGSTKFFGPYYQSAFREMGFNYANYGAGGSKTCEYTNPTQNGLSGLVDRTADLIAMEAAGPYFAVSLNWGHNDQTFSGILGSDELGAAAFDICYREIVRRLGNISRYVFINSTAFGTVQEYEDVVRQIIIDDPKAHLASEIFLDPYWASHIVNPEPPNNPADIHPNEAGSIHYTNQLFMTIRNVIHTNAGSYRKASR